MKSKGYQERVNLIEPWHVYSNPTNPFICPILRLARYIFCNPSVMNGSCKNTESTNQYQLYSKAFYGNLGAKTNLFEGMGGLH